MNMQALLLWIPLLPLVAAAIVGLLGCKLPRAAAHVITIASVGAAFVLSACVLNATMDGYHANYNLYTWLHSRNIYCLA